MIKIGIITILKVNNYGAELQAFALQKKLSNMGYNAEIIDYLYYKHKNHKPTKKSKPFVSSNLQKRIKEIVLYRFVNPFMEMVIPIININFRNRLNKFNTFHKKYTKLSKTFHSIDSLYSFNHNYDVFIVGSDQVWNPGTGTSIEPYFLTFAPAGKRKIAYASSFGVTTIAEQNKANYGEYLSNLDAISVREQSGIQLVKELSGRDAVHVLDPTLLLTQEEWLPFSDKKNIYPNKYILIYLLSESGYINDIAYKLSAALGLPILKICKWGIGIKNYPNILNIVDAGPSEFLNLFQGASFVITNSFHGTAFSVNFRIPFYSIISKSKRNNSRIESLLQKTQLTNRLLIEGQNLEINQNCLEIDFNDVGKILDAEREKSIQYLKNSIEKND